MDTIFITNFLVPTKIGATAEERATTQWIGVDVSVRADLREAVRTKDADRGVNYGCLRKRIEAVAAAREFVLLEEFGEEVLRDIFAGIPAAVRGTIIVRKPHRWTNGVPGVKLARKREEL